MGPSGSRCLGQLSLQTSNEKFSYKRERGTPTGCQCFPEAAPQLIYKISWDTCQVKRDPAARAHTITSPPLTNKEGKKRGAGHSTSFHAGWAQVLAGYAGPFGVTETRSSEVCQRERDHAASRSFASRVRWTVGHCNGNENEANETSERGSVKLDTGLYSLRDLFERVSSKIITLPPDLIYLLIHTICHLFNLG